jgi:hypothetical protein
MSGLDKVTTNVRLGLFALVACVAVGVGWVSGGALLNAVTVPDCTGCEASDEVDWQMVEHSLDVISLVVWQSGNCEPSGDPTNPCEKDLGCKLEGLVTVENRGAVSQWYRVGDNSQRTELAPGDTLRILFPVGNRLDCPDVSARWSFYPGQSPEDGPLQARLAFYCGRCMETL